MSHVPKTDIHRYVGDPFTLRIGPVEGLAPGQVQTATWRCGPVAKSFPDNGITVVDDGNGVAVLVVTITSEDTTQLGPHARTWQAAAGASPPPVVAEGELNLTARV